MSQVTTTLQPMPDRIKDRLQYLLVVQTNAFHTDNEVLYQRAEAAYYEIIRTLEVLGYDTTINHDSLRTTS